MHKKLQDDNCDAPNRLLEGVLALLNTNEL